MHINLIEKYKKEGFILHNLPFYILTKETKINCSMFDLQKSAKNWLIVDFVKLRS